MWFLLSLTALWQKKLADQEMSRVVFATVGTTQFDALIKVLLTDETLALLAGQGYDCLRLQVGRGSEPTMPSQPPLKVEW